MKTDLLVLLHLWPMFLSQLGDLPRHASGAAVFAVWERSDVFCCYHLRPCWTSIPHGLRCSGTSCEGRGGRSRLVDGVLWKCNCLRQQWHQRSAKMWWSDFLIWSGMCRKMRLKAQQDFRFVDASHYTMHLIPHVCGCRMPMWPVWEHDQKL